MNFDEKRFSLNQVVDLYFSDNCECYVDIRNFAQRIHDGWQVPRKELIKLFIDYALSTGREKYIKEYTLKETDFEDIKSFEREDL